MITLFLDFRPAKVKNRVATAGGTTRNAFKQLLSSFKNNTRGNRPPSNAQPSTPHLSVATPTSATCVDHMSTPSISRITRSASSHNPPSSYSPVPFNLNPGGSSTSMPEELRIPLSSLNRGSKRLSYHDIVRMRPGTTFALVIPPTVNSEKKISTIMREKTLLGFKRVLMSCLIFVVCTAQPKRISIYWNKSQLIGCRLSS